MWCPAWVRDPAHADSGAVLQPSACRYGPASAIVEDPRAAAWGGPPLKIEVVDNQIEPALKALKREMLKGGVFKEMKRRAFYEKPSVKRKRKQTEAQRKRRKAARRSPDQG